ncbi:MAG TPA: hypothetical protein VJ958_02040 [Atribacterota bacterium]|nr:hypothetical protein [Atribacterota bacterium]
MDNADSSVSQKSSLQVINILAFLAVLVVNGLANALPIGGNTTGDISAFYPNLFVPAGLTFSIWGVIYLALGIFVIYQARDLFSKQKIEMPYLQEIGWYFLVSCLANISWIFTWHYGQALLSLLAMLVLLFSLIMIYIKMDIAGKPVDSAVRYYVHLPFSLYLGWITVATIANITAVLVRVDWNGWGLSPIFWTVLVIMAGTVIGLINIVQRGDIAYGAVIIWAYLGIIIKRYSVDGQPIMTIVYAAGLGMVLIMAGLLFFRKKTIH